MRLTCPNCGAEYDVPGDAIPSAGRDVQCSNCEEVWYQTGPGMMTPGFAAAAAAVSVPAPKRELDPAVRDILREEASREAEARAEEQASRAFSGPAAEQPAAPAEPPAMQVQPQTPASATPATSSDERAPVEPQEAPAPTAEPAPAPEPAPQTPAEPEVEQAPAEPVAPQPPAKPIPPVKPAVSEESARRLREAAARAAALPKRPQEAATPAPATPETAEPAKAAPRPATTATGASAKAPAPMTGNALVRRPEPEPVEADSLPVAFKERPAPSRTPKRFGFAVPVVIALAFLFVYGQADRIVISIPASEEAMGQFVTGVDKVRDRVTSEGSRFVSWLTARES